MESFNPLAMETLEAGTRLGGYRLDLVATEKEDKDEKLSLVFFLYVSDRQRNLYNTF